MIEKHVKRGRFLVKRVLSCCLIAVLLFVWAPCIAAAPAGFTVLRMAAPTPDGVITVGEWGDADVLLPDYCTGTAPGTSGYKMPLNAQMWFGHDDTALYLAVAVECNALETPGTGRDIVNGDAISLRFAPDAYSAGHEFGFAINVAGELMGYMDDQALTNPALLAAATWDAPQCRLVYELALPFDTLGLGKIGKAGSFVMGMTVHTHYNYDYEWCGGAGAPQADRAARMTIGTAQKNLTAGTRRYLYGDANGDGRVGATDARLVLQQAAGRLTAADAASADVDGDRQVTSTDARLILQRYAGKIPIFPAGEERTVLYGRVSARNVSHNTFSPNSEEAGKVLINPAGLKLTQPYIITPQTNEFLYFAFITDYNDSLPYSVQCCIKGDRITAMLPAGIDLSALIPSFGYRGGEVRVNGMPFVSEVTTLDLTEDVLLTLIAQDGSVRTVTLRVETLDTGLPSVALTTENFTTITSKIERLPATFYIGGADAGEGVILSAGAKGRGNTSWGEPKKGYNVKLDKKARLLGMSESKDWCLIANYEDKSLIRNMAAGYLATAAGLDYVVQNRPVDLWYNGQYWGTYNLCEKIDIEKDRVNVTKYEEGMAPGACGFIVEVDGHARGAATAADAQHPLPGNTALAYSPSSDEIIIVYTHAFVVKAPSTEKLLADPAQLQYIYDKVIYTANEIYSRDWSRINKVVDVESFVRWYIVEEVMNNTDGDFFSSCYMSIDVNGKFKMGPVWDFDRSSGNCNYNNYTDKIPYIWQHGWLNYIFGCKETMAMLKEIYKEMRPALEGVNAFVDGMADTLYASQKYNFERWDILEKLVAGGDTVNPNVVTREQLKSQTFDSEVTRLKYYFNRHLKDMDAYVDSL